MPQVSTRGRNPGVKLSQGERTRWQATIDDLHVCQINERNPEVAAKLEDAMERLGDCLLVYTPTESEPTDKTKKTSAPAT